MADPYAMVHHERRELTAVDEHDAAARAGGGTALGAGTADEVRKRFVARAQTIIKSLMFDTPLQEFNPAEIATR